jgi:hypothetical protein
MPNLSASDYTQYLKFKAAAQSYTNGPPRMIQTVDQAAPNINVINSYLKTSQAAFVVDNAQSSLTSLASVRPQPQNNVNNPNALSTISYSTSGATSSSKFQQPGGLPAKNVVGTYTRLPQNAGW